MASRGQWNVHYVTITGENGFQIWQSCPGLLFSTCGEGNKIPWAEDYTWSWLQWIHETSTVTTLASFEKKLVKRKKKKKKPRKRNQGFSRFLAVSLGMCCSFLGWTVELKNGAISYRSAQQGLQLKRSRAKRISLALYPFSPLHAHNYWWPLHP